MTQFAVMIEGQDGLTWERWRRVLRAAEDFGYHSVFRSDHYTNARPPDKDSLELWISLTYAASHTSKIHFGPLVAPTTFRPPALTARMAAQVDDLSGGRLILGLGAGWQEREHKKYGIPFHDFPTRFDMLEEALEITTRLLNSDQPVSFTGKHFSLDEALLLPRPQRPGGPPILIGGKGPKRTMPLVAKYASEWNAYMSPDEYKERSRLLDELLQQNGRQPQDVKRTLMTTAIFAADDATIDARLAARNSTREDLIERGALVGTAAALIDQIGAFVEVGVERFMLQWLEQDDIDGLERIARDVMPHFQ